LPDCGARIALIISVIVVYTRARVRVCIQRTTFGRPVCRQVIHPSLTRRVFFFVPSSHARTEKPWDLKMTLTAAIARVTRRVTRARSEQQRLTAENAEHA